MRPTLAALLTLPLALALACGDKDDDSGNTGDGGSTADGGSGEDGGSSDGGTEDGATLTGRVVMEDGSGASVQMRLCAELCRTAQTDGDGNFEYLAVEAGHYALEAVYLADQHGYATPLDFVTLGEDEVRDLGTDMILYEFATSVDVGSSTQQVAVDGGLSLTVDPANLTASSANSPLKEDSEYVAGVAVDPSAIGLELEEIQGEVLAAWFMGRMSVRSDPPAPFVSSELYGLSEGDSVRILAADYDTKEWLDGGTATVTKGELRADASSGIPAFSTVLFVAE